MRTTISFDMSILENAKAAAVRRGVTLSEFVQDAVLAYLSSAQKSVPEPLRLHTVRGQLVQPELDLDRMSALLVTVQTLKIMTMSQRMHSAYEDAGCQYPGLRASRRIPGACQVRRLAHLDCDQSRTIRAFRTLPSRLHPHRDQSPNLSAAIHRPTQPSGMADT